MLNEALSLIFTRDNKYKIKTEQNTAAGVTYSSGNLLSTRRYDAGPAYVCL